MIRHWERSLTSVNRRIIIGETFAIDIQITVRLSAGVIGFPRGASYYLSLWVDAGWEGFWCFWMYVYIEIWMVHVYILSSWSAELRRAAMPGGSGMGGMVGIPAFYGPPGGAWWRNQMDTCNLLVAKLGWVGRANRTWWNETLDGDRCRIK
jgi:hypothetical protein